MIQLWSDAFFLFPVLVVIGMYRKDRIGNGKNWKLL